MWASEALDAVVTGGPAVRRKFLSELSVKLSSDAAIQLQTEGVDHLVDTLTPLAQDANHKVASEALRCMSILCEREPGALSAHFSPLLSLVVERFGHSKEEVRRTAASVVSTMMESFNLVPEACDRLIAFISHKSPRVREQIHRILQTALPRCGSRASSYVKALADGLDDKDKDVRSAAVRTIDVLQYNVGSAIQRELQLRAPTSSRAAAALKNLSDTHLVENHHHNAQANTSSPGKTKPQRKVLGETSSRTSVVSQKTPNSVDVVRVYTESALSKELNRISESLVTDLDWKVRLNAIQRLRGLVAGGVAEFPSVARLLQPLRPQLAEHIADLRSVLSRETCTLVTELARAVGDKLDTICEPLLGPLFSAGNKVSAVAEPALSALRAVFENVQGERVLRHLLEHVGVGTDKLRVCLTQCLLQSLHRWRPSVLKTCGWEAIDAAVLKCSTGSAGGAVKSAGRECAACIIRRFPSRSQQLLEMLPKDVRKKVDDMSKSDAFTPSYPASDAGGAGGVEGSSVAIEPKQQTRVTGLTLRPENATRHPEDVQHRRVVPVSELIDNLAASDWSCRFDALSKLRSILLKGESASWPAGSWERVVKATAGRIQDTHHRCAVAAILLLEVQLQQQPAATCNFLDTCDALIKITGRLSDTKEAVASAASRVYEMLFDLQGATAIISAFASSFDRTSAPASRIALLQRMTDVITDEWSRLGSARTVCLQKLLARVVSALADPRVEVRNCALSSLTTIGPLDTAAVSSYLYGTSLSGPVRTAAERALGIRPGDGNIHDSVDKSVNVQADGGTDVEVDSECNFQTTSGQFTSSPSRSISLDYASGYRKESYCDDSDTASAPVRVTTSDTDDMGRQKIQHILSVVHGGRAVNGEFARLVSMIRLNDEVLWGEVFGHVLMVLLDVCGSGDALHREMSLMCCKELLRYQGNMVSDYVDLSCAAFLKSRADANRVVAIAAEEALTALCEALSPVRIIDAMSLQMPNLDAATLQHALRILCTVIKRTAPEVLEPQLTMLLPPLFAAFKSAEAEIRKQVVFCLVACMDVMGDALTPYLGELNARQLRLVTMYSSRSRFM